MRHFLLITGAISLFLVVLFTTPSESVSSERELRLESLPPAGAAACCTLKVQDSVKTCAAIEGESCEQCYALCETAKDI